MTPDIRQGFGLVDIFCPSADEARNALADWRQSVPNGFEQVEVLVVPTIPSSLRPSSRSRPTRRRSLSRSPRDAPFSNVADMSCSLPPVPLADRGCRPFSSLRSA
jgi:hypothetical protein